MAPKILVMAYCLSTASFTVLLSLTSPNADQFIFCSAWLLWLHPFNGLFSRTTWVRWYQKGKTSLDLNEARSDGVSGCSSISLTICKQSAPCFRQTTTPTPHHSIFTGRPDAIPDAQPTVSKHGRQWVCSKFMIQLSVNTLIMLLHYLANSAHVVPVHCVQLVCVVCFVLCC